MSIDLLTKSVYIAEFRNQSQFEVFEVMSEIEIHRQLLFIWAQGAL